MRPMRLWITEAICRGTKNPDIFYPSVGGGGRVQTQAARIMCGMCPVQKDCLDYAVAHDEEGFWGGKTLAEREALPGFIRTYIKDEYERLGFLEHRLNIDGLILSTLGAHQVAPQQEDQSSWLDIEPPPFL